jgi:hypothetical protein
MLTQRHQDKKGNAFGKYSTLRLEALAAKMPRRNVNKIDSRGLQPPA